MLKGTFVFSVFVNFEVFVVSKLISSEPFPP